MARHYFTTPLYYVNAQPHIGHAYATVLVDALTRYYRLFGDEVYFLTGTDEHGQKVMKAAEDRGLSPQAHADELSQHFRDTWPTLHVEPDVFYRTTDPKHIAIVQAFLTQLKDNGLIYEAEYEGWYSASAERFWSEEELVDGRCPDTGLEVQWLKERNYFFKMSAFEAPLRAHIEANPEFILPVNRRNEVLGFLDKGLQDLCISRPKDRMSWGIPIPFAPDHVTYVWFDALSNYVSALGGAGEALYEKWWPSATHVIGKDILTTHAVYWGTMLLALGLPLPRQIVATGWWLAEDRKMSKSLGNVVDPLAQREVYGPDVLRYYLMRDMVVGLDANFSEAALVRRNNSDLANDLGNLLRRSATMVVRNFDGKIPDPGPLSEAEEEIKAAARALVAQVRERVDTYAVHQAIEDILQFVRSLNKYVTDTQPFKTVKTQPELAARTLYMVLEGLRVAGGLLGPIMPEKMRELLEALGAEPVRKVEDLAWGGLKPGTAIEVGAALFPRRDLPKPVEVAPAEPKKKASKAGKEAAADAGGVISFDDFLKVEMVAGKILEAEAVEGADKLLKLQVDLGEGVRQIVSGIAKAYQPEALVGRMVVVVKNLAPRKIFKIESQGMLLAADTPDGGLALTSPGEGVAPGTRIS